MDNSSSVSMEIESDKLSKNNNNKKVVRTNKPRSKFRKSAVRSTFNKKKYLETTVASSTKHIFTEINSHVYFQPRDKDAYNRISINLVPAISTIINNHLPMGKSILPNIVIVNTMIASIGAMLVNIVRGSHFGDANPALINIQYAAALLVHKDMLNYIKTIAVPKDVYIDRLEISILQLVRVIQELFLLTTSEAQDLRGFSAHLVEVVNNMYQSLDVYSDVTKEHNLTHYSQLSDIDKSKIMAEVILILAQSQAFIKNYCNEQRNAELFAEFKVNNRIADSVIVVEKSGSGFSFLSWNNAHTISEDWIKIALEAPIFLDFCKVQKKNRIQLYDVQPESFGAKLYWNLPYTIKHNEQEQTIEVDDENNMIIPSNFKPKSATPNEQQVIAVTLNKNPVSINYPHMSTDMVIAYAKDCDKVVFCLNTNAVLFMKFSKSELAIAVVDRQVHDLTLPQAVNSLALSQLDANSWVKIFDKQEPMPFLFE